MNANSNKSRNRHIAFICNGFPIKSETFVSNQVLNAVNNDFDVSIHVEILNSKTESSLEKEISSARLMEKVYTNIPINIGFFKRCALSIMLTCRYRDFNAFIRSINIRKFGFRTLNFKNFCSFSSLMKCSKPDLIHAHFGNSGVRAVNAKLCGIIDCPVITSFHGYDAHAKKENLENLKKYYSKLFSVGDIFIVNGRFLKDQLTNLGCPLEKIRVVPIGVNVDFFRPKYNKQRSESDLRLITTGRLTEFKNQQIGIKVIQKLHQRGVKAFYTLIGSGPEEANLKALANSLNVSRYVIFLGAMSQTEIVCELQKNDIFLMSSDEDNSGRTETQGIVTAEAQACGLPVITLGMGGTKDTIEHGVTGYNVFSKKPEDIIESILSIIDSTKYVKFSENARNFVENNYNIEKTNFELFKLYNEVINKTS